MDHLFPWILAFSSQSSDVVTQNACDAKHFIYLSHLCLFCFAGWQFSLEANNLRKSATIANNKNKTK